MRAIPIFPVIKPPPREIYILAGESDMSGRGLMGELPSFANSARVKIFTNAWVWASGFEPTDSPTAQVDTVSLDTIAAASCGMSFATSLAALRPGVEIALVPCAKGGSKLADWSRSLSRSTLYGSMLARAKEAAKVGTIKGLVWWQGKNDTGPGDAASAASWAANCTQLIEDLRADLAIADLPVVIAVIDDQVDVPDAPYVSTVQAQQRSMTSVPNVATVETDGLPMKVGDPVHLSTSGLVQAGEAFAGAMHGLLA